MTRVRTRVPFTTIALLSSAIAMLLLLAGCVINQPLNTLNSGHPAQRVALNVRLEIDKAFKDYTYHIDGTPQFRPLGENLTAVASRVVQDAFVVAPDSASTYTLQPQLRYLVDGSTLDDARDEASYYAAIEWQLLDEKHNLIWVKTVHARGAVPGGLLVSNETRQASMQRLMQDLFDKSRAVMQASFTLQALVVAAPDTPGIALPRSPRSTDSGRIAAP